MAERTIGIIAGKGLYPPTFATAARANCPGVRLVCAAFTGETEPKFADEVDSISWFRVGQLGKMLKFLRKEGVQEAVMVGQISPDNLFNLRPDLRVVLMLAKLKRRNAETIFGALADELAKDKIDLLPATTFLDHLLAPVGHIAGPTFSNREVDDATYGFGIAKESSRLDIGQSVVVRQGTVVAVEAFEGTNECIRRGGQLGRGKDLILAKVSKPDQDLRFDVPVLGPHTIDVCAEAGVHGIVVEAGLTLLLGKDEIFQRCQDRKVTLHGLASSTD